MFSGCWAVVVSGFGGWGGNVETTIGRWWLLSSDRVVGVCVSALWQASLNDFMAKGREVWRDARSRLQELLAADTPTLRDDAALRARAFVPLTSVGNGIVTAL